MKISLIGKLLAADFGLRVGKKYLENKKLAEKQKKEREEQNKFKYSLCGYTKQEAIALVNMIFDHPTFQVMWNVSKEEANQMVLMMSPEDFFRTFGTQKPRPRG